MAQKINFLDLDYGKVREAVLRCGCDAFRTDQLLDWIYKKGVNDFGRMSNFSKDLREKLESLFSVGLPEVVRKEVSKIDGSTKFLLKLADGERVETVRITQGKRQTVCVSSQAGCKFRCVFCASGASGFRRNLTAGEMVAQVLCARDAPGPGPVTHVVFMGMGEPLDNYDQVLAAVRRLNHPKMAGIGARRITISTAGVVPGIEQLSKEGIQVELSVSLHAWSDEVRGALMRINGRWPLGKLIKACREYFKKTRRMITFEYVLAQGINASPKDAGELARLLSGLGCMVNLIPLNPVAGFPHKAPPKGQILAFQTILKRAGIVATIRYSRGSDIHAACGQLAAEFRRRPAGGPSAARP